MSWASEQVERYRELEPLYDAFADRLHDLLVQLVQDEYVYPTHSYGWARDAWDYETALFRARREGRRLGERLEEVGDVAGVALIVSTPAEVDTVAAIVERELVIDYSRSLPPAAARAVNQRNFSSEAPLPLYEHATYIVTLDDNRRQLREWRAYADLQLEVHLPTQSQYGWWAGKLHYPFYWPTSLPPPAREAFARVAALLASVDDALTSEAASRESVDGRYAEAIAAGELDFPLDARALVVYMTRSETLDGLVEAAVAAGMEREEEPGEPSAWMLEQRLLWLLARVGIATVAALHEFLEDAAPRGPEIFRRLADRSSERGFVPVAEPENLLLLLLLVLNRADAETIELAERRAELEAALNIVIGNPLAPELEKADEA